MAAFPNLNDIVCGRRRCTLTSASRALRICKRSLNIGRDRKLLDGGIDVDDSYRKQLTHSWMSKMAPKTEPGTSRTIAPSLFSSPPLGTKYQIVGGSGVTSYEETRKRLNNLPDFIPERGYRGYDLRELELIPGLPNDVVAECVWPRIREGDYNEQVKNMLNMRFVSKFWCAFMDHSDLMDQVMMENCPTRKVVRSELIVCICLPT